jgi:hypothetical protein
VEKVIVHIGRKIKGADAEIRRCGESEVEGSKGGGQIVSADRVIRRFSQVEDRG